MKSRLVQMEIISQRDLDIWGNLLTESHPLGNAFLSPTFTNAVARAYGRVEVCVVEEGASVVAIFPFQFPSRFATAMRAAVRVGEEMSDYFGVLSRPDFKCSPARLLDLARLEYVYFTHMPQHQLSLGLTGESPKGGLLIDLHRGGEAYWSSLQSSDPKFAGDTERRERKAIRELGVLRFSFDDHTPGRLSELLAHKRAQYLRTGKGDWLAPPGRRALIEALSASSAMDCRGTLSTLWFGDTWAAMHFGLRSGKTLHYWFPVYNPELAQFAPGRLLLRNIILNAAKNDVLLIDRGLGESEAKNDFPSERQLFYSGAWHRPGLRSFTYRAYQSATWRVGQPVARWLNRRKPASESGTAQPSSTR